MFYGAIYYLIFLGGPLWAIRVYVLELLFQGEGRNDLECNAGTSGRAGRTNKTESKIKSPNDVRTSLLNSVDVGVIETSL
jgi:hypothetical protein